MQNKLNELKEFLQERHINFLGVAEGVIPSALDAWLKYVVLGSVKVNEKVPIEEMEKLELAFDQWMKKLSLDPSDLLLSIEGFPAPWVRADLTQASSIIKNLRTIPGEPSFILASESERVMLAVDTEEWDYLLIAAKWEEDGRIVAL